MSRIPVSIVTWLVVSGALVGLLAGCGTDDPAMPLEPVVPPDPSAWATVYPEVTNASLTVAWGMDPDDLWIGGDRGTMLHWDGRAVARVEFPSTRAILDIQGRTAADAWALTESALHHWDGRRWSRVHDLPQTARCFHLDDDGGLIVGGYAEPDTVIGYVKQLDGGIWRDMPAIDLTGRAVYHIWQPSPDHRLTALTSGYTMQLVEGVWMYGWPMDAELGIRDVAGDLALTASYPWDDAGRLLRVMPTGQVVDACPDQVFTQARALVQSRHLLLANRHDLRILDDCHAQPIAFDIPRSIWDLAVPQHAGPAGATVFAVGSKGLVYRGAWQPGGGFAWQSLMKGPTNPLDGDLDGNATLLVAKDFDHLLIRRDGVWSVTEVPFNVHRHRVLDDGRMVLNNGDNLAVLNPDGSHATLPAPPFYLRDLWCDGEHGWAASDGGLWRLEQGAWALVDTFAGNCGWLDARDHDDVYLRTSQQLLHHDGHQFTDLTPLPSFTVYEASLGHITGRVYLEGHRSDPSETYLGVYEDGQWTRLEREGGGVYQFTADDYQEITSDLVVRVENDELLRRIGDRWVPFDELDVRVRDVWGHPEQGLFVSTNDDRILRRDLPDLAP